MADEAGTSEDPQITFKVKTSSDGNHTITMAETATVLDLKNKLAGADYENIPADRQRLIYSGRVMKNEEPLSTYKIKAGNTIHMVKSAQSNVAQNPATASTSSTPGAAPAAAGVPTNMAAGTANNPLAALTGARYAGHLNLPGRDMFGADGGVSVNSSSRYQPSLIVGQMGAPPNEDQMADMLSDPATAQLLNEALSNPQMIDLMIQSNPTLRQMGPQAREVLQSPMFRQMMTNPDMLRQAAAMRRMMGGGAGEGAFPAPGVTDTTPQGAAGTTGTPNQANTTPMNPFALFGGLPGTGARAPINPFDPAFQALFNPQAGTPGHTPTQSPPPTSSAGQGTPAPQRDASQPPPNPFGLLFTPPAAASASPFGNMTPEMMQQAMALLQGGGLGDLGGLGGFGGTPPPPVDNRPPEELYADQLRQLNDMGFVDFDRNVQALRRSGGSVQGAVNQLLG